MRRPGVVVCLGALAVLVATGLSCRTIRNQLGKVGIGRTVETPDVGSPEEVVQNALRAGLEVDMRKGWSMFRRLLHSSETSPIALRTWEGMRYPALRAKTELYVEDTTAMSYTILREERPTDDEVTLFLENAKSDVPTPCTLKTDPKNGGEWRIKRCSL